jgi:Xaa-Pro aminopeptidase
MRREIIGPAAGRIVPAACASPEPPYLRRVGDVRQTMAEVGVDALVVTHPPNLRYLCGFDGSLGALLITGSDACLIVDGRYITVARERAAASEQLRHVRIELAPTSLEGGIAAEWSRTSPAVVGVEGAAMTLARFAALTAVMPARFITTERVVERARLVKDDGEIEVMRLAARMLSAAAAEALGAVRPGRTEIEVAADAELALRRAGFSKPAFETIVASGPNSALPHARPGRRVLRDGDGVVLDFGGVYDGYCVDLTRTVQLGPVSGSFRRMFEAVRAAHAGAIASVKPGVAASVVDTAAREALTARGLGEAFVHGTGHGLGLEVHEEPRVTRQGTGRDEVLQAGMIFTVEPGAYVPGIGGVRIEDDVLVTAMGCEVLTAVPIDMAEGQGAAPGGHRSDGDEPVGD